MNRRVTFRLALLLGVLGATTMLAGLRAKDPEDKPEPAKDKPPEAKLESGAIKPKPLGDAVKKGLAYLVSQQHENGGWGQGGGWRVGQQGARVEGEKIQDPPDVASTCIATLALLRAGNTPKEGEYAKNVARGIDFICANVEKADKKSLYVTDLRGTQVQSKIGPYVDTFLASMVLAEIKGRMGDVKTDQFVVNCLNKIIGKIEDNIKEDGTVAGNTGWAATLSQGLCCKGLNRARQMGAKVSDEALARVEKQSAADFDAKTKTFRAAGGAAPSDAGVPIYNSSAKNAGLAETVNTQQARKKEAVKQLADKETTKEVKDKAKSDLGRIEKLEAAQKDAADGLLKQIGDKQFVAGFGSNGGEEFLSYMNISETLIVKGGKEWEKWDKQVAENLDRIQNKDGSWSGHHCITGKTFCTSTALLVLLADRAPVPVAAKIKDKK